MAKLKKFFRYENVGMLFVLPAFLYMLIFVGYPIAVYGRGVKRGK